MLLKKFFHLLTLILITLFLTACAVDNNQMMVNGKKVYKKEPVSPVLMNEISQILLLVKQNNLALLNIKYIHPSYGFYDITMFEKENTFKIRKSFTTEFSNVIDDTDVKIEKVNFNCSPLDDSLYGWDKEGVFLDTQTKPYITDIMEEVNLLETDKFKKEDLERADFIEQTSYEITIPYNVIFYLTKIENNWYITLIDNVKTDCSEH